MNYCGKKCTKYTFPLCNYYKLCESRMKIIDRWNPTNTKDTHTWAPHFPVLCTEQQQEQG